MYICINFLFHDVSPRILNNITIYNIMHHYNPLFAHGGGIFTAGCARRLPAGGGALATVFTMKFPSLLSCWCESYEAISPPGADVLRHAVTMLERLGAVSDNTGAEVTPLGAKLAKLQVGLLSGSRGWIRYDWISLNLLNLLIRNGIVMELWICMVWVECCCFRCIQCWGRCCCWPRHSVALK